MYTISTAPMASLISLDILVNNNPIPQYNHKNKIFIEGRKNSNYSIRVKNNNIHKVLAIISVDGLCINDGKPASEASQGWIVDGLSELVIPGWLVNSDAAAKFKFAEKDKSYAEKSENNTNNVGVIGCMIFEQKNTVRYRSNDYEPYPWYSITPYQPHYYDYPYGSSYDGYSCSINVPVASSCSVQTKSTKSSSDEESLGTAFGSKTDFKTTSGNFERGCLLKTFVLYYDSRKNLEKIGIQFDKKPVNEKKTVPNPFPASSTYCTPPDGWQ